MRERLALGSLGLYMSSIMKILAQQRDTRIDADNYFLEIELGEYVEIAKKIILNNEFQRRRVKASPTIYSLLKEDLMRGCIVPPIVLATTENDKSSTKPDVMKILQEKPEFLLILDGLQRTASMIDLVTDLTSQNRTADLNRLLKHTLRLEVYAGINRIGVLYRMLTLNTGQTPMSLRQQVEILFLDYARIPLGDIRLIRESDGQAPLAIGQYSFKAVIDGFSSYLERNELPIDRYDLLESIKGLERISKEDDKKDVFHDFILTYHQVVMKFLALTSGRGFQSDELGIQGKPFGSDCREIFSKEQAIAGFGAAIGRLRDFNLLESFDDVAASVASWNTDSAVDAIVALLQKLETIRLEAKKIGNAQRLYFHYYFRELFNKESDGYRNPLAATESAYRKYQSQTL